MGNPFELPGTVLECVESEALASNRMYRALVKIDNVINVEGR